jgi:hypothetical protein
LNISGTLKYQIFKQQGDQANIKRDRSFFGLINKADYNIELSDRISLWPKWKSTFRRETPTEIALPETKSLEETLFLITRYSLLPGSTWIAFGVEFSNFENLAKAEELQIGEIDDFNNLVLSFLFSNTSAYLGYKLTMNTGFQWESQSFKENTRRETLGFVRVYASAGTD